SVTVDQPPNVPQVPFVSAAVARSTTPEAGSTPAAASGPVPIVRGIDAVVYQGPPGSVADWPTGPVVSETSVNELAAVPEAPFVNGTVLAPEAVALDVHE